MFLESNHEVQRNVRRKSWLSVTALLCVLLTACAGSDRCTSGTLGTIASSYAATGKSDRALEIAKTMPDSALKARVLGEIAAGYTEAGQEEKASEVLSEAFEVTQTVELPADKAMVLEAIARQYWQVGEPEQAAELLSQALQVAESIWGISIVKDTVVERIALVYSEMGDRDRALQVAETILGKMAQSRALAQIAIHYAKAGDTEQAIRVAETIEAYPSRAIALIEIAAQTGEDAPAVAAAQSIESPERQSIVLAKIAALRIEEQQYEEVLAILTQAQQAAVAIEELPNRAGRLAEIARLYEQAGYGERGAEVLSEALRLAREAGGVAEEVQLASHLVADATEAGQVEFARSTLERTLPLVEEIESEANKSEILGTLASAATTLQPHDWVMQFANRIEDGNVRVRALMEIAEKYAEVGEEEQAAEVLLGAFQGIRTSEDSESKVQILGRMARQLAEIHRYEEAIAITQAIDAEQHPATKALTLANIASLQTNDRQKENAIALLSQALTVAQTTKCH
jgi:tetratricopeptide (TPR) repeat protein